ncbi:N-acetylglucosaminyl-phosphatidylinositol de-N-acetylase isoform X1 [Paramormyrops kingsleyae]|uniref:N-acetylglucosaminylphosphatidylinositol deacetylase n=1 Tax=Paramormyrops kingsleyae TaxID=1676925 RepID=A0A3B3Q536_9TELE|nr:N-acetylglucosaminyl-phosphatidylinositol de-N-acetylase isoform X1 [Paramormyrops kingsleyae]
MFVTILILIFSLYLILTKIIFYRCRSKYGKECLIRLISNQRNISLIRSLNTSEYDKLVSDGVRALLVTAHPDDECMFFAPTILRLLELNVSVHLLCLSSGNYYNQGNQRQKELLDSCDALGIPSSQVIIVDNKELPDSPAVEWSIQLISSLVLKQVKESSINLVLTFDVCGVSGHANHTAIYKALRYLGSSGRIPDGCCFLSLQSVSMIRKYLSILELPISWILASDYSTVAALKEYRRARAAMLRHRSQLLWFRHLYLLFSRYMLINTFQVIAAKEKDLKSQ